IQNFINGKFEDTKSYIDSFNPATNEVNAKIPDSDENDVNNAVKAAKTAFLKWSALPDIERARYMTKIADIIESRLEDFAIAESKDQGKPLWLSRTIEIPRAVENFRFFAASILHSREDSTHHPSVDVLSYTTRQPVGVAALISPWNLPLYLLTWKIAPCLAFGCTCVCKPSEFTSVTASMLCQVFNDAG
ncbi:unnamed protein product, partial [Didymodactylos carnosus]